MIISAAAAEIKKNLSCPSGHKRFVTEWLGHSDISTTMNIYAHLDTTAKDVSAAAMSQALSLPEYNGGYGWQR